MYEVWRRDVLQWYNVNSKFSENRWTGLKLIQETYKRHGDLTSLFISLKEEKDVEGFFWVPKEA